MFPFLVSSGKQEVGSEADRERERGPLSMLSKPVDSCDNI